MNVPAPVKFGGKVGLGAAAVRKEDQRFITGQGRFCADLVPEGALFGHVLRSSHAHARFCVLNLAEARQIAGVHLILTHADIADLGAMTCKIPLGKDAHGKPYRNPPRPVLADGVVRFVGDPIAFIVAESRAIAADVAEFLDVDYEALPVVVGVEAALADGAPIVWPDHAPDNRAYETTIGEKAAVEAAFTEAARIVELKIVNNRLICNYMEPRVCLADYDAAADAFTLTLGSQGVHKIQASLADLVLKVDRAKMRVITPDVGGAFGTKNFIYHEYALTAVAARALRRPVAWIGDRSEHFVADVHGRDNVSTARLALDGKGRFLALDVEILADMGAYLSEFSVLIPWFGASMATGVYDIPLLHAHLTCAYTNTTPTDAYRGAGRPEAAYLIERLVNHAAAEIGMDATDLRRLNFVKPAQFPYRTPAGRLYDVGDFDGHMTRALMVSDWADFSARRAESAARGRHRGIGLATYIEACAFAGSEPAYLDLNRDGSVTLRIGTQAGGQGHETAYAQFVAAHLDLPLDQIEVRQGDTLELESGGGTGGSRSIPIGGVSVDSAAIMLARKIKEIASDHLEAASEDLELVDGMVRIVGTDRMMRLADVAALSDEPLTGMAAVKQAEATYPNGTHVCELEVDPETGVVNLCRYTVVDDFGVTVNPVLLAGQVHGGIVQGIGQALHEHAVYDASGQLLSASLMDYGLPRADHVPDLHFETRNIPSTTNALGIKGAGEAGAIGSCPAIMNALVDALYHARGIRHVDMPALPRKIWALLNESGGDAQR